MFGIGIASPLSEKSVFRSEKWYFFPIALCFVGFWVWKSLFFPNPHVCGGLCPHIAGYIDSRRDSEVIIVAYSPFV